MKKILVFLTLITLTACGAQTSDKILTNGYTDSEKLIESRFTVDEVGFDLTYRTGLIEELDEKYNYSASRRIEFGGRIKSKTTKLILEPQKVYILGGCNINSMTDKKKCHLNILTQNGSGGLHNVIDENENIIRSCVIGHDYPGKTAAIRIDKNKPFYTDENGCIEWPSTKRLQSELTAGSILLVQYSNWPSGYRETDSLIDGRLDAAKKLYRWAKKADMKTLFKR